ncbi:alcohol dehydrogenase [Planctomycetota bacterium]|nr:alcohol dehydrogenase [Planctomycetota bacterium]
MATILLPGCLEIGDGSVTRLPAVLDRLGCRRPLVLSDPTLARLGIAGRVVDLLAAAGIAARLCTDTVAEPTAASLLPAIAAVRSGGHDAVVAVGGGSPIDSAKAVAVLARHGGTIRDYRAPRQVDLPGLPVVAIPTTAGTGSEVTRFTVITDETCDEKLLCVGPAFLPAAAIVDAELTLGLPPRVTADTGLDALTHAVEAYVSGKANAFTDQLALAALGLIGSNLRRAYRDGGDRPARSAMMLGATLAGISFSNASVALVHGLSRPIGAHFHVPHGLSNAMLLPAVTAFSLPAAAQRYAQVALALGLTGADQAALGQVLLGELEALNRDLAVPTLADFGVDRHRFLALAPQMADQALASGSPANNPRVPDRDQIIDLYRRLWS